MQGKLLANSVQKPQRTLSLRAQKLASEETFAWALRPAIASAVTRRGRSGRQGTLACVLGGTHRQRPRKAGLRCPKLLCHAKYVAGQGVCSLTTKRSALLVECRKSRLLFWQSDRLLNSRRLIRWRRRPLRLARQMVLNNTADGQQREHLGTTDPGARSELCGCTTPTQWEQGIRVAAEDGAGRAERPDAAAAAATAFNPRENR